MKADERKEIVVYIVVWVDDENFVKEQLPQNMLREEYGCRVISTIYDLYKEKILKGKNSDILINDVTLSEQEIRSRFSDMEFGILSHSRKFYTAKNRKNSEAAGVMVKTLKNVGKEHAMRSMKEKNSFIVRNALQFIDEHYSERITLEEVAKNIYVSKWHLSKLLNKEEGRTFSQIINTVRIEKAKELLKDSSLRIGDVAELVGFLDISHFSRMFKKIEGISANDYRNLVA